MHTFVSVIIPVYNDPKGLTDTVRSLIKQDYDLRQYEVIIADNGSNDETLSVAYRFQRQYPERVKVVVENKIQSSYAARNKGIKAATGDLLCFIDADVVVEPDYLSRVANRFEQTDEDYLGCNVKVVLTEPTLAGKYDCLRGFNIRDAIKKHHYTPTCNLVIRKEVLGKVGEFDSRLESGGDFEFGQRVHEAGLHMAYADEIVVYHPARWRYSSLVKKAKRIARGCTQLAYYYPDKYRWLHTRYFELRPLLPSNPVRFYLSLKEAQTPVMWLCAIVLAFYHIPIRGLLMFACFAEARRLKSHIRGAI